ncbi:hypothetical protein L1987_13690 [Smallanthus sonchifolius]|uniref:Uncharacterized protein n=1 Tax=Smallanthus sonchifolius TaxID=185202 RepID=A0ACB9JIS4_9ASTR|nr:hypothetical protein L1987_13690 [Smallanthus sonchifolius]
MEAESLYREERMPCLVILSPVLEGSKLQVSWMGIQKVAYSEKRLICFMCKKHEGVGNKKMRSENADKRKL